MGTGGIKYKKSIKLCRYYMMKRKMGGESVDNMDVIPSLGIWETIALDIKDGKDIFTMRCVMPFHEDRNLNEEKKMYGVNIEVLFDEITFVKTDVDTSILNHKLSRSEKRKVLGELFSFNVDDNGVVYDEEGDEFHGYSENDEFDLDTMSGIMIYQNKLAYDKGKTDFKKDYNKLFAIK